MKLRFSTRDLIWLLLVAAVLLTWFNDHRQMAAKNRFTVETIRSSDNQPIELIDNETRDILFKDDDGKTWHVGRRVPPQSTAPTTP
jgi:hypothetical protein